jgi:nitronate monooxygenase
MAPGADRTALVAISPAPREGGDDPATIGSAAVHTRLTELLGIEVPIVQAPMAGSTGSALAIAVAAGGGLGSLPCAMLGAEQVRAEVALIRAAGADPFSLNFFCHAEPADDPERMRRWLDRLAPYATELGVPLTEPGGAGRGSFDSARCELVEQLRPPVVSFHYGLPAPALVDRVHGTGAVIMSSATTVAEARWLQEHGCDVVIAQGIEAGGHRAMFLTDRLDTQLGTMALVPQVVDAVTVPVIAAGGIGDARGIAAALALGADGVQIGTALLLCPEAGTGELHRQALAKAAGARSTMTNVFTGRPARSLVNRAVDELGPMSDLAPAFPLPVAAMAEIRAAAEALGSPEFSPFYAGQAAALARPVPAAELLRCWATELSAR